MSLSLEAFGWDRHWADRWERWANSDEAAGVLEPAPGRVIRHDGAGLMVALGDGSAVRAMFGPKLDPAPVVGDWIVVDRTPHPVATLPRDTLLRRRAAGGDGEQHLVANLDLVLIVCGLDRPVRGGRIQRTVTLANDAGADSLVVLTKGDLVDDSTIDQAVAAVDGTDASLDRLIVSAGDGTGIDVLLDRIGTRTVALIGESGAGKSTLVNALVADDVAAEGGVRAGDSKGRHTTTSRELFLLPGGGILVDTPGIREVGVFADSDAVAETFPELDDLASTCRFRDCAHGVEPGCAIAAALADGSVDPVQVERWKGLGMEAAVAEIRSDPEQWRRASRAGWLPRDNGRPRYGRPGR